MKHKLAIWLLIFFLAQSFAVQGKNVSGPESNPVSDMLERIDRGASKKFRFVVENDGSSRENSFFELSQKGSKVLVKGDSWVSIATGVNWYLKHYCGIHIAWNNPRATLPAKLPRVKRPERHATPLTLRYNFNYCTFSYTMAFWDWARWEQEIDWMALHGVNLPLAVVGEECVWRKVLLRLGYSDDDVSRFIAGPAFLAWWEMNNLEGWGGPLPDSWYAQQEALQKKILQRMRAWGMEPVLPGYGGMVPSFFGNATGGGKWNGYTRPAFLQPTDAQFRDMATIYYEELTKMFGQANYYSMDPFHEGGNVAGIDLGASGKAILHEMKRVNPQAVWVIQSWQENPRKALIQDLPKGDLLILDLYSECKPKWNDYGSHDWLFCMLENFGGNVGLHGRIDQLLGNFEQAMRNSSVKGIGFTPEGLENNPVMFELMSELPWCSLPLSPDFKTQWIRAYCRARYGVSDAGIEAAWQILANTIYNCPPDNDQQGTHESIFCARPSTKAYQVSTWSGMKDYYDADDTRRAAQLFIKSAEKLLGKGSPLTASGRNNLEYDLVDIVRQALADQGRQVYEQAMADFNARRRDGFEKKSRKFLDMILAQDRLLGTREEFRLGRWTESARSLGRTEAESNLYEWNARVQITTWGDRLCADRGGLHDYAHKEWQGLLRDFYHMRWCKFFDALTENLAANADSAPKSIDWYALEEPWTKQTESYSPKADGNALEVASDVWARYLSK